MCWLALVSTAGASFSDDFSHEPISWRAHNPGAVRWDSAAGNLAVTWDSRQTNSFFYFPLGTTLTRNDSFDFEFTLRLDDLALGIDPAKQATFPICLGFLNLAQAKRPEYFRGAGVRAANGPRSLVEFAYFADDGFGATIGPIIASTNNQIAYSHSFPVELTIGETFRIKLSFDATNQILTTRIDHNGQPYGMAPDNSIRPLYYTQDFGDFRVDAFSVHSYSDAGQFPEAFAGSVLAHGVIDDVVLHWPDPPQIHITGRAQNGAWIVSFETSPTWAYSLERSADLGAWEEIANGPGPELTDPAPPANGAFYRVGATRP
jgi:hypothetical protein